MTSRPALALGTVQFGLAYGITGSGKKVPDETARAILKIASAAGVTRLDTAAAYGDIEERLAGLIGDLPLTVVSKIPALPTGVGATEQRAFIEQAIERSLDRLGGLMVGILFHDASLFATSTNKALWDHAASLCARLGISLGLSGYDPDQMATIAGQLPVAMAQLPANAFDQRIVFQQARLMDCEMTLRSIFLQGLLLAPEAEAASRLPAAGKSLAAWREWHTAQGLSSLEGAIAVAQTFPADYCVVGVDDPSQFEAIAEVWHRTMPTPAPDLARNEPAIIDPRVWPKKGNVVKQSQHQDRIFADSEGDAWYRRNKAALAQVDRPDALLDMVRQLPTQRRDAIRSICDVGCSNGERLARFASALPHLERLCGFDASAEAVSVGKAQFPEIDLRQGIAGEPPFAGPFDLVTISFVLHWVDRSLLAKTLAAVDGLLADGGVLILSDFLPDRPCARRYHHRDDVSLYTFKQDYVQAFTGLGLYREVARTTFSHSEPGTGADASIDQERAVCAMLVKSLDYPEIAG